jgi:hypothetical protein
MFSDILEVSDVPIFRAEERAVWRNKQSVMQGKEYKEYKEFG